MYATKRIFAYAIDLCIVFFITTLFIAEIYKFIGSEPQPSQFKVMLFSYGSMAISAGIPIILFPLDKKYCNRGPERSVEKFAEVQFSTEPKRFSGDSF